jgi:hypothetical protein
MPNTIATTPAAESPQPSTKGRWGPSLLTEGDLERARPGIKQYTGEPFPLSGEGSEAAKAAAPIPYPHNTEDRLCDVAGSIRAARELIEHLPEEMVDYGGGRLVSVLQMLQIIEREVRAIGHGAIELKGVAT